MTPEGNPIFSEENAEPTPFELSSWINLPEDSLLLGPGGKKRLSFSVKVPSDASPGAHFGGIFFDLRPPKLRTTGTSIGYRIGSIISLRISGDVVEEARLREFTAGKLIYNTPEVNFRTKVENLGNVLIRPHGLVEITDMLGKKVSTIRVNEKAAAVFPKSERDYDIAWQYDGFAFGRYQAVLSLVYGEDGRKTISAVLSFWVLPLKPIAIALGTIIALILIVFILVKIHIRKKLREMYALSHSPVRKYPGADMPSFDKSRSVFRLVMIASVLFFFVAILLALLFLFFA